MRKRRLVFFVGIEIGSDPEEVDEGGTASAIGFEYNPSPPDYEVDNNIDPEWDDRKKGFGFR